MPKIKIIQIALAAASDSVNGFEERSEYLDDQGRVWFQTSQCDNPDAQPSERIWVTKWHQLVLPDEPEAA